MESVDDAVRRVRRMEENANSNLKCIAPLIARVQDDTRDGYLSLFTV
jgi:hypothetical protein